MYIYIFTYLFYLLFLTTSQELEDYSKTPIGAIGRLWVNRELLIDSTQDYTIPTYFVAGQMYDVFIEYTNTGVYTPTLTSFGDLLMHMSICLLQVIYFTTILNAHM